MAAILFFIGVVPTHAFAADPMAGSEGWLGGIGASTQVSGFGAEFGYAHGHHEVRIGVGGLADMGFGAMVEYRANIWPVMFLDEHVGSENGGFTLKVEGLPPGASLMLMPFLSASLGATPDGNSLGFGPALTGGLSLGIGSKQWPLLGSIDLCGGKAYDILEATWEPVMDVGFTVRPAMNSAAHERVEERHRKNAEVRAEKGPKYEYVEVPGQINCDALRRASEIEMQQAIAICINSPYPDCVADHQGGAFQAYQDSGCLNNDIQRETP